MPLVCNLLLLKLDSSELLLNWDAESLELLLLSDLLEDLLEDSTSIASSFPCFFFSVLVAAFALGFSVFHDDHEWS
jgi:hypothetical protein